jgi:hypothetical protein
MHHHLHAFSHQFYKCIQIIAHFFYFISNTEDLNQGTLDVCGSVVKQFLKGRIEHTLGMGTHFPLCKI